MSEKLFYLLILTVASACAVVQSGAGSGTGQTSTSIPGAPVPSGQERGGTETKNVDTENSDNAEAAQGEPALEAQIRSALSREPTLTGESLTVRVSPDGIELSGSVATTRERLTATRLALSYAPGRRVISKITVGGANKNVQAKSEPNSAKNHGAPNEKPAALKAK